MLCVAVLTMAACSSDIAEPKGGAKGEWMPVSLSVLTADYSADTRAQGTVKGVEGIAEGNMQLFCFDDKGFFLGLGQDVVIEPCADGGEERHAIRGVVPNSTARIHFVANAHVEVPASWVGLIESNLMSRITSRYDTHEQMVYWGYKRCASADAMKRFLSDSSNLIYMLRDRAKVTVVNSDSNIKEVSLVLCGGADRGTVAPYDKQNPTDPFPQIESRDNWNTTLTYVSVPADTTHLNATEADFADVAYTYETDNDVNSSPLLVILRARYNDGTVRYHKVMLQNENYENYTIKRNHTYQITVKKMGAEYGNDTFEAALNGQVVNDVWVSVRDIVAEINAGEYTLTIRGGSAGETSLVYFYGANTHQTIPFTFTYTGTRDVTPNFSCTWTADPDFSDDLQPDCQYGGNGMQSTISFTIKPVLETNTNLSTARIQLRDRNSGLSRNINLYRIAFFSFDDYDHSVTIGKGKGEETKFKFTIPDNYPKDLFPVTVKFASGDINPRDMGVEVGSTLGDPIEEEWNCWFVKKYDEPGEQVVTLRNIRDKKTGELGKFYMKAEYFGKDAASVNKAIEIPITFQ